MGKGGQNVAPTDPSLSRLSDAGGASSANWESPFKPLDKDAPEIPTLKELKAVIPAHCFERSLLKSCGYLIRDYIFAAAICFVAYKTLSTEVPSEPVDQAIWALGWFTYAFWQSNIMWGLFVMGHECGHGSFSKYKTINDVLGFITHQLLLVPYFAWQYSHAKHHRRTNHTLDGESHVFSDSQLRHERILRARQAKENGEPPIPMRPEEAVAKQVLNHYDLIGDDVIGVFQVWAHLAIGWYVYMLGFVSGGKLAYDGTPLGDRLADHFRPNSPLFPPKLYNKILLGTVTVLISLLGLAYAGYKYGALPVFLWYINPYMIYNAWLILYTWLHHTDPSIPHYGPDEWTFVKGALGTIDRSYGPLFDFLHHNIGPTHVVHHVFSEIPFYNQFEATAALKEYLEPKGLYNCSTDGILKSMWHTARNCHLVHLNDGIQYPITVSWLLENHPEDDDTPSAPTETKKSQ